MKGPSLSAVIKSSNREELLNLLQKARVSVGYLNGRRIGVEGYKGQMTFSKIAAQVESHYQTIVEPMQLRQKKYEKESASGMNPMRAGLLGSLFVLPVKLISDVACWISTPYPEVSEEEEKEIASALQWRRKVDEQLDSLFAKGQEEINSYASKSCFGRVVRVWDSFLDRQSSWSNSHKRDEELLKSMVENRRRRAEIGSNKKALEEAASGVIVSVVMASVENFLALAKYRPVAAG